MKLIHPSTLLTLLTLLTPPTLSATDYENAITCAKYNAAIESFCNRRDKSGNFLNNIAIPSPYATRGASPSNVRARIEGSCKPAPWVPLQYCSPQFHEMCAQKQGKKKFGRNKCQTWLIEGLDTGKVAGVVGGAVGKSGTGKKQAVENLVGGMKGE